LRLFDLGLAKELQPKDSVGDGLYLLTECCGTPRYMASEVAIGRPYNEGCDVYSFALLCWQMASLKVPYDKYTLSRLKEQVWSAPYTYNRPPIDKKWPEFFKRLLCQSWSHSIKHRPTMKEIESILAQEVGKRKKEFDLRSHLLKRRSSMVLHKVESMRIEGNKEIDNMSARKEFLVCNPYI
jgi:serine/threonine protein kinase